MISQPGNIIRRLVLIIIVTSLVSACAPQKVTVKSSATTTVPTAPAARSGLGERAAAVALNQVGVPYRFGGTSPSGFDCSGLVYYSYSNVGKSLPRTTAGLWTTLQPVEDHRMRAGDLLFFNIAGKMSHVGMYLGGGIPPRILSFIKEETFMNSFTNKGRMSYLLKDIPVKVILNPKAALIGAASFGLGLKFE